VLSIPAGPGLELRLLDEADTDVLHALVERERAHLARWMPWAAGETPVQTRAFVRASQRRFMEGDGFDLGIFHEGALVGCIGLHHVHAVNRSTSMGYWIGEGAQGRGIALAACRALLAWCFGTMDLHRVELRIAPDNARSLVLARRLGFAHEGTLREAERMGDGWLDLHVLSLLAREWRG
jgi:ribosomal-protein-serine acetyltransferase